MSEDAYEVKPLDQKFDAIRNTLLTKFNDPSIFCAQKEGDSGQVQFWSEPSEILNLRSSNTPEAVAFTIP